MCWIWGLSSILGVAMKVVKDIQLQPGMSTNKLVNELYESGGFTAKKLGVAVDLLERMIREKDCIRFLSFPACICATGTRGVIKELLKRKLFDVVVTTGGTLDHDLARVWKDYYHGSFLVDDRKLHKKGINRLGNIFIPHECYGAILEEKLKPIINELYSLKNKWSTKDLIWEFGKALEKEKRGQESIVYWAWKNKIPVFVPGITDGAFGSQLWMYYQNNRDFVIDLFKDEQDLSDIVFGAKKTGALIIGGGISKHHTLWWNQFKDGLDFVVYVTTAVEYDGSLSGAYPKEAVSWGKVTENADTVIVEGDATVVLPIIISSLFERLYQ